ncbi:hypothetical protein HanIR_Chr12g0605041 [Helianthus annuus]|nr:hypothetical protein HanIR_Chr12g0605041 [Helianthus annuus]
MDSFMNSVKTATGTGGDDKSKTKPDQSSNSDLMTSAKTMAGNAQSAISNQSEKIVVATTDLMTSAKEYGSGFGAAEEKKVPDQSSNSDLMTSAKTMAGNAQSAISNQSEKIVVAATDLMTSAKEYGSGFGAAEEKKVEAPEKKEESGSGFGADAFKAAGNLFKKN